MVAMSQQLEQAPLRDEERWQAVLERDRSRDGQFVLGVRTTGIYCRPSCPARKPKRENVVFFGDPDAAERAGFRACRRCKPRSALPPREEMVSRATAWLDAHSEERVTLSRLAAAVGVSPGHVQRSFTDVVGVSPRQYVAARRMEGAKALLRNGDDVTTALYAAGYGSSSRFYEQARDGLGMTPTSYRKGGEGVAMRYGIGESRVGRVLVGATERGVCAVSLGEDDAMLESALRAEYPNAEIVRDDQAVGSYLESVVAQSEGRTIGNGIPLDVAGTPFQRRVWQTLRTIPAGQRRTYGEIAAVLGNPKASRAVASACAANPVAVVVPCHRVVRGDGGIGGYRWGEQRKDALLAAEREAS